MADVVVPSDDFSPTNIAALWWNGGCSVVPIRADHSKQPHFSWKNYQSTRPTKEDVRFWFEDRYLSAGVAVICGAVSGNLEMLELEGRAFTAENMGRITAACSVRDILDLWLALTHDGYTEVTPSGGLHILYRISDHAVSSNEKVARRPANEDEYTLQERQIIERQPGWRPVRVLAETRGEGGYVIVAPTSGLSHRSGQPWRTLTGTPGQFLTITWDQRNQIHAAIREVLDQPLTQELELANRPQTQIAQRPPGSPLSVAEDFNLRSSWHDSWFTDQGWQIHHQINDETFWTRPGKDLDEGHSATTGFRQGEADCLYVWSTSTSLPAEKPLTKFMVYAHYVHNGDMRQAARFLQKEGYGPPPIEPTVFGDFEGLGVGWVPAVNADEEQQVQPYHMVKVEDDLSGGIVLTDVGYALRMRDCYVNKLRYNSTLKEWYLWQPGIGTWLKDEYEHVDNAAQIIAQGTYDWLVAFQRQDAERHGADADGRKKAIWNLVRYAQSGLNTSRISAVISRFRTLKDVVATSEDFDASLDLLNLRNGTFNLTTYELKAHDPGDLLTLSCNASYNPDADCPLFIRYIEDVIPDKELREYVQRAMGYSLLGKPFERALFLLHGPSGTGKSVFTDIMTHLFGDYGTTAPSSTFKQKKQEGTFDLHQLRGKRFVTTSEMPEGAQLDEELVKRLTGGDVVPSRGLYEKYTTWHARCVIWIGTNFLPRLNGDDNAMWRRVRTIPMRTEIKTTKEEIKGLGRQLQNESDGILNWIIDGLKEYRRIGLAEPETVLRDINEYRTDTDSVASWLATGIEEGHWKIDCDCRTPVMLVYNHYVTTCQENGITQLGKQRFTKRLSSLNSSLQVQSVNGQRVIVGIKQASALTR